MGTYYRPDLDHLFIHQSCSNKRKDINILVIVDIHVNQTSAFISYPSTILAASYFTATKNIIADWHPAYCHPNTIPCDSQSKFINSGEPFHQLADSFPLRYQAYCRASNKQQFWQILATLGITLAIPCVFFYYYVFDFDLGCWDDEQQYRIA